jgi:hypothetical protein
MMAVQIDLLDDKLMDGLEEFSTEVWNFPAGEQFLRWRIVQPPGSRFYVAHDNGRWLAGIGGQHKTYLNKCDRIDCLETYAWASLRVRESKGWGIKVMKALMTEGKPLVALGGSPDTLNFMPRLGFETLASAPSMVLPLRGAFAAAIPGIKGALARAAISANAVVTAPKRRQRNGLRLQPLANFDARTLAMPSLAGFQAVYETALFEWQLGWPEQGAFLALRFVRDSDIVGWLYVRMAEEGRGELVGRLLESKFSPETTAADHKSMMSMMVSLCAGFDAVAVRALTTCPDTNKALTACHFRSRSASPAMIYHEGTVSPDQAFRVSVLRADGGAQPLAPDALRV